MLSNKKLKTIKKSKNNRNKKYKHKKNTNIKNIQHTKRGGGRAGNNNQTVMSLQELLNYLITNNDTKINAINEFQKYIDKHYTKPLTRNERYDITILCAIMNIMFDYTEPVNYTYIDEKTNKISNNINANEPNVKCCDKTILNTEKNEVKLPFFTEDIYCEDLNIFIDEYNNFMNDYKSNFFYKSNVANIALLFKCYYKRCFDDYLKYFKYEDKYVLKNNFKDTFFDDSFLKFKSEKNELLNFLIIAYNTCFYDDICNLYIKYLEFYYKTLGILLKTEVFKVLDIKSSSEILKTNLFEFMYNFIIINLKESKTSKKFFIYLTCFLPLGYKQSRFYMTRFIDSYIGQGNKVHEGEVINTIDVIGHDFLFHGNIGRIKATTQSTYDNINKIFIMDLYNNKNDKTMYKFGMHFLQYIQNEKRKQNPTVFNKQYYKEIIKLQNIFQVIAFLFNTLQYNKQTVIEFFDWLIPDKKYILTEDNSNFYIKNTIQNLNNIIVISQDKIYN